MEELIAKVLSSIASDSPYLAGLIYVYIQNQKLHKIINEKDEAEKARLAEQLNLFQKIALKATGGNV